MSDYYLPPEFLTEEDILTDFKMDPVSEYDDNPSVFNSGCGLSESMENEEFLAGLTRKMDKSTLLNDLWKKETMVYQKVPKCPSPPIDRKAAEWEFLYAAAKEIVRKKKIEMANAGYQNKGLNTVLSPPIEPNPSMVFPLDQPVSYQQLQTANLRQMKSDQLMKQQQQAMAAEAQTLTCPYQKPQTRHVTQPRINNGRPANLSKLSWPTPQQSFQPHQQKTATSGKRAVFQGNTSSKIECAGTGVFLPRGSRGVTEPCRKPGCAAVELPDRMVQTLNLNMKAMDETVMVRNNVPMCPPPKQILRPTSETAHTDIQLPQEWTY